MKQVMWGILCVVALSAAACAKTDTTTHAPDIETFMQIGRCGGPAISEDGKTLYFTSNMSGIAQLYRMTETGWPMQLTFFPDGIDYYTLSHNGQWAIVGAGIGGNENSQLFLLSTSTGRAERVTNLPQVQFGGVLWSPDDAKIYYRTNEKNGKDFHIHEMILATRATRPIVEKEGFNGPSSISPDGKRLVTYTEYSNSNNDLYEIDLATLAVSHLTPHQGDALYNDFWYAADGKSGYTVSDANPDRILRRAKIDVATRKITFLDQASTWEVERIVLSPDRTRMAWVVNEDGYANLHFVDLTTGKELPTPPLKGMYGGGDFDQGTKVVFSFSNPAKTPDCFMWDWSTKELKQYTFSTYAGIDPATFIEPQLVRYPSFDGKEIPAFLFLPRSYQPGHPVPFIVEAHGGPEGQARPSFVPSYQYLLANGYGILTPNPRGSTGYGTEFMNMDNYTNRMKSVKDYEYANRFLAQSGYAIPDKIAIMGGSYGGYMVLACLTENPDLWAAGIDVVGIANFVTFLRNTSAYRRALREAEYGPLSDSTFLLSISPMTKADKIIAPLLIVHGENDPRVPVSEARQIAKAIGDRGGVVDTLIFPDEGHGIAKRPNRLIEYRRRVDFLNKYMR